jgi:hypothetical protein
MNTTQPRIYDTHSPSWESTGLGRLENRFTALAVDDLMKMVAIRYPDANVPTGFVEAVNASECCVHCREEMDGPKYADGQPRAWWEVDLLRDGKAIATFDETGFENCDAATEEALWQALQAAQAEQHKRDHALNSEIAALFNSDY